ncbi:MAG: delta-60 repeat domain-containing protein [Verrucomicrobiae bacterium]|nr:delta-60 repeat domain-containing protein [Verrucomicrobiae bacterium]
MKMRRIHLSRLFLGFVMSPVMVAFFCACENPPGMLDDPTVDNIRATVALLGGTVDYEGDASLEKRGIVISRVKDEDTPEHGRDGVRVVVADGTDEGVFTVEVGDLVPGAEYAFRAFAESYYGIGYSEILNFTTLALEVSSPTVSNLTDTTATLGGEVITDVPGMVSERGVVFSEIADNDDPIIGGAGVTKIAAATAGAGVFSVDITGLMTGGDYAFKAYASIDGDTVYSETAFFPETVENLFDVTGDFVSAMANLPDGRMIVGGKFEQVDGEDLDCILMLDNVGDLDFTYTAGVTGFDENYPEWIQALGVQNDGKVLIGGVYNRINGVYTHANLGRLNADGSEDSSFLGRVGAGNIECLGIQPDGKILVGGYLITLNENERHYYFGRLLADGGLDTTFNPGPSVYSPNAGPNGSIRSMQLQEDGKILVAGFFNEFAGEARPGLARLNADGTLDMGFDPSATVISADCFLLQPDGKILVGGFIVGGYPGVIRLNSDASLDTGFAAAELPENVVVTDGATPTTLLLQADGKILVGGVFDDISGVARDHLGRLNPDGSLDSGFDPFVGFKVAGIGLRDDGTIVAGGVDYQSSGPVPLLTIIPNDASSSVLVATSMSRLEWTRGGSAPEVSEVVFEMSTNGGANWVSLGSGVRIAGGWEKTGLSLPGGAEFRARGRTVAGQYGGCTGLVEESTLGGGGGGGVKPTVTMRTESGIEGRVATLGASVESEGSSGILERGVVVSRTLDNEDPRVAGFGVMRFVTTGTTGAFTLPIAGLTQGTNYSYRGYATNSDGTGYTTVGEFKTHTAPTLGRNVESSVGSDNATVVGSVLNDGGSTITEHGAYFLPVSADTERLLLKNDGMKVSMTGTFGEGSFFANLVGLAPGTEYIYITYASNAEGTGYSSPPKVFTTNGGAPSISESLSESGDPSTSVLFGAGNGIGPSASPESGFQPEIDQGGLVQVLAEQADGRIIVAGDYLISGPNPRNGLGRLNSDGSVDTTFRANTDGTIYSVVVQGDGKILIAGLFSRVNGTTRNGIARLNFDGSVESSSTFDVGSGADNIVYAIAVQPDGKILLGGLFGSVGGSVRNRIARLEADGGIDESFDPGTGPDDAIYSLCLQPDGRVLIGGAFESYAATSRARVARLEPNGTLDSTFNPGSGFDDRVVSLAMQADGKVLAAGFFTQLDGLSRNRIARMGVDGAIDGSFTPGSGADGRIYTIVMQADGRILVGGVFQSFNGTARNRIARLNGNGSLDSSFDPGSGANDEVDAVALQEDGRILVGGAFSSFDGLSQNGLVRLDNDVATAVLSVVNGRELLWTRGGSSPELSGARFELSTDGGLNWLDLGVGNRVVGGWSLSGQDLPVSAAVRSLGVTSGGFLGGSIGLVEDSNSYDHTSTIAALQAQLNASRAAEAKLAKQIKSAKKKKKKALAKSLAKKLKAAIAKSKRLMQELSFYP